MECCIAAGLSFQEIHGFGDTRLDDALDSVASNSRFGVRGGEDTLPARMSSAGCGREHVWLSDVQSQSLGFMI